MLTLLCSGVLSIDSIGRLHLKGDGLVSEGLNEDLRVSLTSISRRVKLDCHRIGADILISIESTRFPTPICKYEDGPISCADTYFRHLVRMKV